MDTMTKEHEMDAGGHVGFRRFRIIVPLKDRIWIWIYYNKIPIDPIFYLLKGDYR